MTPARSAWRDATDQPVDVPEPPDEAWYRPIGDFQGELYRRNAFAMGTADEVEALVRRLDLRPGQRVLDVGCGNGRHLAVLAERGIGGVGVDVSLGLLRAAAATGVDVVQADARRPPTRPAAFDAAWSVCQGGLGTDPRRDRAVLAGLARAVRPGGAVAATFFHALFAVRHLAPGDAFDTVRLLHHQATDVVGPDGERRSFDLWTSAYTVREAVTLVESVGLTVEAVVACAPGSFDGTSPPGLDDAEFLLIGRSDHIE